MRLRRAELTTPASSQHPCRDPDRERHGQTTVELLPRPERAAIFEHVYDVMATRLEQLQTATLEANG